jgi:hypothetical protein
MKKLNSKTGLILISAATLLSTSFAAMAFAVPSADKASFKHPTTHELVNCARNQIELALGFPQVRVVPQSIDFSQMPSGGHSLPARYTVTFKGEEGGAHVASYFGEAEVTVDRLEKIQDIKCSWNSSTPSAVAASVRITNMRHESK